MARKPGLRLSLGFNNMGLGSASEEAIRDALAGDGGCFLDLGFLDLTENHGLGEGEFGRDLVEALKPGVGGQYRKTLSLDVSDCGLSQEVIRGLDDVVKGEGSRLRHVDPPPPAIAA